MSAPSATEHATEKGSRAERRGERVCARAGWNREKKTRTVVHAQSLTLSIAAASSSHIERRENLHM